MSILALDRKKYFMATFFLEFSLFPYFLFLFKKIIGKMECVYIAYFYNYRTLCNGASLYLISSIKFVKCEKKIRLLSDAKRQGLVALHLFCPEDDVQGIVEDLDEVCTF